MSNYICTFFSRLFEVPGLLEMVDKLLKNIRGSSESLSLLLFLESVAGSGNGCDSGGGAGGGRGERPYCCACVLRRDDKEQDTEWSWKSFDSKTWRGTKTIFNLSAARETRFVGKILPSPWYDPLFNNPAASAGEGQHTHIRRGSDLLREMHVRN